MTSLETATTKRTRTRLDPLVLDAIAHTQRNSVSRALSLLADPPAHIPLEHLTLAGNSLISALGRCGRPREALQALERLAELGAPFDSLTAAAAVSACSRAVSKVGTLPRPWAERGWAIYRGYIAAAEAVAAKGEAEEKEEEEEEEEAEEEEEEARRRRRRRTKKAPRPIRDRPLLRALLDCGSRSMDPEMVWAALREYDLAGIRPGPSELAALVHAHARRRTRGADERRGGGGGENDGENDGEDDDGDGGETNDPLGGGGRGSAARARGAGRGVLERYGDRWDTNTMESRRRGREGERKDGEEEGGEEEKTTPPLGGGDLASAARARAAAREFLERYGDRWDPNIVESRRRRRARERDDDEDEEEDESSSSSSEEGEEEERRKIKAPSSSLPAPPPPPSASSTLSMMTPSVYNALLRAHARAGDLDGAYAVRRAMASAGVAPDSGTCRALSECFGDSNVELAADLVEAAEAERVEALLSRSGGGGEGGVSGAAGSPPLLLHSRPREALPFPPALAPPRHLMQREWSLFPILEADDAAILACQGPAAAAAAAAARRRGGAGAPSSSSDSSSTSSPSSSPSLPPPLVLDLHGMSRPAARVVVLVSLRRIVAAAAEPGRRSRWTGEGVLGGLTRRRLRRGGGGWQGAGFVAGFGVPGGLVLVVGRSGLASSDAAAAPPPSRAKEKGSASRETLRRRLRRQRARERARALLLGNGGGGSEVDKGRKDDDGGEDGDDYAADGDDHDAAEAAAKAAARAASRAAHMGAPGGLNASVLRFATERLGLRAALDPRNAGRVVVAAADLDAWVLAELERRRRGATAELAGKQAAAVAAVASSAFGFWWVVPKLLAI